MFFLFLAVLSSATMTLILKYSEVRQQNRYAVTTLNYIMASLVLTISIILSATPLPPVQPGLFLQEFHPVVVGNEGVFSPGAAMIWILIIGMTGGCCFCAGLIFIQKSIEENGVSITGAFAKLGIVIPLCFALFLWKEIPTLFQFFGISMAFVSILMINPPWASAKNRSSSGVKTLVILFLVSGMGDFMAKLFEKYATGEAKLIYLWVVFSTALFISAWYTWQTLQQGHSISRRDIITGVMVGIPNMLTSYFLISAFKTVKTSLVFPLFSSGVIFMVTLGGVTLFREKLGKQKITAICMIVMAVIFMNTH
ncbi:EamA-like transporter family protein [Desulfocicer vacuolatum DSM 3385]|uniref:EamA-like transporter family protein n=1 Tax=Desulfocicer vacuolatum DSM 3385 TaxID=1121400 RepID=A0A1W2EGU9_9BACT|nr:EamA family transporter [Desulfocicer vacuolatum]SMD08865.1 EamA-like transporter family protein [Desulfocicer vacuolatum DSM 3385]